MYKIIQHRNIFFILSAIIIIPGIIAVVMGGLKLGIDFTGGSMIELTFNRERPTPQLIQEKLASLQLGTLVIQPLGSSEISVRLKTIDNDAYQKILSTLRENFGDVTEKSFESIGPTFGAELKNKAITATILVLIFILLYITFAFRKAAYGPVKSWVFGTGAVIALIHDILVVVGVFAILGKYFNVEIDTLFITALLTVLGFSVHDTIVVYDRIRERLRLTYNKTFEETVNESINQTLVRSLNTSLTTLLVLSALYLFGGESIRYFVLALLIGITAGTYSSIFIASPLLVIWHNAIKRQPSR
jgi:preprotein translocase subunit SecF